MYRYSPSNQWQALRAFTRGKGLKMSNLGKILGAICGLMVAQASSGQVVITSSDMNYDEGLYYKAHSNGSVPVSAVGLIGSKGGPNFWDFTEGPAEEVIRFDYVAAGDTLFEAEFPGATVVERSSIEGTEEFLGDIYLDYVDGVGRKVFGFVRDTFNVTEILLGLDGPLVFSNPQVDFPSNIKFGDAWSNVIIFETNQDDSGGLGGIGKFRIVQTDDFLVDAFGFAELPRLGFVDVLRVNSVTKTEVQIQQDESFVSFGPATHSRIYRWLGQGKGIVAELSSEVSADLSGNAVAPPETFEVAGKFYRMFETNKQAEPGCELPDPVTDLRISYDVPNNRVFLRWSKVDCASFYRVMYSNNIADKNSWQLVEETNKDFSLDLVPSDGEPRWYRIESVLE